MTYTPDLTRDQILDRLNALALRDRSDVASERGDLLAELYRRVAAKVPLDRLVRLPRTGAVMLSRYAVRHSAKQGALSLDGTLMYMSADSFDPSFVVRPPPDGSGRWVLHRPAQLGIPRRAPAPAVGYVPADWNAPPGDPVQDILSAVDAIGRATAQPKRLFLRSDSWVRPYADRAGVEVVLTDQSAVSQTGLLSTPRSLRFSRDAQPGDRAVTARGCDQHGNQTTEDLVVDAETAAAMFPEEVSQ